MITPVNFHIFPISYPSLCIPRVFANIDEKKIRTVFNELVLGDIRQVDIISKKTEKGENYSRVFIHFNRWFANSNSNYARERVINGKEIKIVYDEPWFWKVSAYRSTTNSKNRHIIKDRPKPRILFEEQN